ncbi:DUF3817 domain-containing protein [Flagellimonas hymeniacidonis]|uniref:DUF3817 domain-containing protein n=1 Tax=Flagellimonas hymeniacidonis TaxID=2603628 RepID=A0A5C8V3R9_9FLAO|nr:DUF3817 domain-containing protein [Flagellimonas hymeniacidonis]TXN36204.1 DUF3817 domain-containing protein [Flagellimonas hymeniacidonis]
MLKFFRLTAILEGISYLLLFGMTMPLKYWAGILEPNKVVGYAHGGLFIAYVIVALAFCWTRKWSIKRFIVLFMASLLPFGTFYADKKYLKGLSN